MNWNDIFEYRDGKLYAKVRRGTVMPGKAIGRPAKNGYLKFMHNYRTVLVHRVIWEMHHGPIPPGMTVDHIDMNRQNNRIENLRLASVSQQRMNSKSRNPEYPKNISRRSNGAYRVQIKANGAVIDKQFQTLEAAVAFADAARPVVHGEFACSG